MGIFRSSSDSSSRFSTTSDSDLQQSLDLVVSVAEEAHSTGNKKREAAAHQELNSMIDEVETRGWFGRR